MRNYFFTILFSLIALNLEAQTTDRKMFFYFDVGKSSVVKEHKESLEEIEDFIKDPTLMSNIRELILSIAEKRNYYNNCQSYA